MRATVGLAFALPLLSACSGDPDVVQPSGACASWGFSDRGQVRVFVVGHRQLLTDDESYASFEQSYRRHVEQLEPCLAQARPNLLVFPENAALGALLLGSRGKKARAASTSTEAFVSVLESYQEPFAHYQKQSPAAGLRRQLLAALTDVVWRAFEQTFGGIARDYGVWVMANADLAPPSPTKDPALVALLGDPEALDPTEAFIAPELTPFNSAYLFDPSGASQGRVDKVFLVPSEESDLDLANGSFEKLRVFDTPFARIGVATSRDAFYAPFMQRLEDLGVELVVQPEAFSGWTVEELPGDWLPDVFLASGYLHTQKYRTIRHSLNPVYTGNFFELPFDGQAHVTEKARPEKGLGRYVGQDAIPGFSRVGPWVMNDDPALGPAERRSALRQVGEELLPGSGSPRENGYVDSLIGADLVLEPKPVKVERDATLPESRALAPAEAGSQLAPDLTVDAAGTALAVWQDDRSGTPRIRFATSKDGVTWSASQEIEPGGVAPQRRPAACSDGARALVVWQEGSDTERVRAASAASVAGPFSAPVEVAAGSHAQWWPDCGFVSSDEVVVWTDFASGVGRVRLARRAKNATQFDAAIEVDPSTATLPRLGGSQLEPAISEREGQLAWLDYRDKSWDVYTARFDGTAVTKAKRVDGAGAPDERERLHGEPRVEAWSGRVVIAWSDLRERRGHADIGFVTSDDSGATWSKPSVVPGGVATSTARSSGGDAMPRYRPALVVDAAGAELVFQDLSPSKSGIGRALLGKDGSAAAPTRLDDTGSSPVSLTRPRAARLGTATLVLWEDDRDGNYRIYASRTEP